MTSATKHPDIFAALAAPFDQSEVKSRAAGGGRQVQYVTARTILNRFDEVLGPENWWYDLVPVEGREPQRCGVICKLTVRLPDGSTITKSGMGGYRTMTEGGRQDGPIDPENTFKTAGSDALKIAAVAFGPSRYLYADGTPDYGDGGVAPQPQRQAYSNGNGHDRQPSGGGNSTSRGPAPQASGSNGNGQSYGAPRSGKGMFAWCKEVEQKHTDVAMVKYLQNWGKLKNFPDRMVDWDEAQTAQAHAHGMQKLASISGDPQAEEESQDQPPPPPRQVSPGEREMAGKSLANQQRTLTNLVWQLAATVAKPGAKATDEEFWRSLAALDGIVGGSQAIEDIQTCTDAALLADYIEAAKGELEGASIPEAR